MAYVQKPSPSLAATCQRSLRFLCNHRGNRMAAGEITYRYSQLRRAFKKPNKKTVHNVLAAMSLQKQSNQLINDPAVRNSHKGK